MLLLTQYFWPENFRINDVAARLLDKGHAVEVLTGKPNYPQGATFAGYRWWGCQQEQHEGINIHRIPVIPRGQSALRLAANYLSFVLSGLVIAPWMLRRRKFDVIFVYAPSPILQAIPALSLGRLKDCPVVLWVQDLWPESLSATGYVRNRLALAAVRQVVRWIYRHTDSLLVQSRAFEAPVRALACTTPVAYFPNSVDDAFSTPATDGTFATERFGRGFSVVFAGNLGSAQAVGVIVEAASLLKDFADIHFLVVGDGSRWDWMRDEVERRGLANVHLPGRYPVQAMPALLQKASVLLVTLADEPTFALTVPNKIQAYLAAGRPILASLNGEGARIVQEAGAGMTSAAGDPVALAAAVRCLYAMSPAERDSLGENGRAYFKTHFDGGLLIGKLIGHLSQAVRGKGVG